MKYLMDKIEVIVCSLLRYLWEIKKISYSTKNN